jgi:hypothetical protein
MNYSYIKNMLKNILMTNIILFTVYVNVIDIFT